MSKNNKNKSIQNLLYAEFEDIQQPCPKKESPPFERRRAYITYSFLKICAER